MGGHEQARFYFDQDMESVELMSLPHGEAAVYCARCPAAEVNEDAAGVLQVDGCSVLAVADGMGGLRCGEAASRLAIEALAAAVLVLTPGEDPRIGIVNGIEAANQAVRRLGGGSGSTLAVLEVCNGCVRTYHVGDAKILVFGQRGKLKLQTVSHAPVARIHDAGLLSETAALRHEDLHIVTNFVGEAAMRIELGSLLQLAARDTVLVASDGLYDNMRIDEIVACMRKGPLAEAVQRTASLVRGRMEQVEENQPSKPDDLTMIAYRKEPDRGTRPSHA